MFGTSRSVMLSILQIGWRDDRHRAIVTHTEEHMMRNFDAIAALRGEGLRPELRALLDRVATAPCPELFVRGDGMLQSGPDTAPVAVRDNVVPLGNRAA